MSCHCCNPQPVHQTPTPAMECIQVNSVIGSKTVQKVAELTLPLASIGIPEGITPVIIANPGGIVMRGTLIDGKVINSGYVPILLTIPVATPVTIALNLPFQAETEFPGACTGDQLTETLPVIEGVIPPVITPAGSVISGVVVSTITLKAIIRTTITVTRSKIVQGFFNVCGDVNPDRCVTVQPTAPTVKTQTFFAP